MSEALFLAMGMIIGAGIMGVIFYLPRKDNLSILSIEPFGNTTVRISRWKVKYDAGQGEREITFPMVMSQMEYPDRFAFHKFMARQAARWQTGTIDEHINLA